MMARAAAMLEADPASAEGLRALQDAALEQRSFAFAIQIVRRLSDMGSRSSDQILPIARAYLHLGQVDNAESLLKNATNTDISGFDALRGEIALMKSDPARALEAFSTAVRAAAEDSNRVRRLGWTETYLRAVLGSNSGDQPTIPALTRRWQSLPPATSQGPVFVVLDYKSPDFSCASTHLDDYLWSIAALRHFAAATTLNAAGVGLDTTVGRLQRLWPTRTMPEAIPAELTILDRDSLWEVDHLYPGRTIWAVLGGRLFKRAFSLVAVQPSSPDFQAIVVDLELHAEDFTAEAIAWLRRFQPIGCRDRTTAERLLNYGVDAFVSGCLVSTLIPVDARRPASATGAAVEIDSEDASLRTDPAGVALMRALDAVERCSTAEKVAAANTPWYLACEAMDVPVKAKDEPDLQKWRALFEVPEEERRVLANALATCLRETLSFVAAGASASAARARWSELTQGAVDRAKGELAGYGTYLRRPTHPPVRNVRRGRLGGEVTVAFSLDRNYLVHLPIVLHSIRMNTEADLNLVFLTRGLDDREVTVAASIAQPTDVMIFPMEKYLSDIDIRQGPGKTTSVLDRLFFPDLLPNLDRLVYLDLDLIVRGDVAELASFEPSARGIAARPTPNTNWATAVRAFELRSMELDPGRARRLRGLAAAATDLAGPYFNAGVLVLSLERLRKRRFIPKALRVMKEFGLNDQDTMNLFAGGDFTRLPWIWNANPHFELVDGAKLIHWAGVNKPWLDKPVLAKRFWQQYAVNLATADEHVGSPTR
jgi:lipopolysaccharide biosynthesis glycosyltransferase